MRERRAVSIDTASESPVLRREFDAVVLVDVLCDTTTLVTAAAQRRQTFPASSAPAALSLARALRDPILATSESETWRTGFEMSDGPAALGRRTDTRPLVLACPTGATLASNSHAWPAVYLACLRNVATTARLLALRHERVLVINSASDVDVRCEDQIAAARLGRRLVEEGFAPLGLGTRESLDRWAGAAPEPRCLGPQRGAAATARPRGGPRVRARPHRRPGPRLPGLGRAVERAVPRPDERADG